MNTVYNTLSSWDERKRFVQYWSNSVHSFVVLAIYLKIWLHISTRLKHIVSRTTFGTSSTEFCLDDTGEFYIVCEPFQPLYQVNILASKTFLGLWLCRCPALWQPCWPSSMSSSPSLPSLATASSCMWSVSQGDLREVKLKWNFSQYFWLVHKFKYIARNETNKINF